MNPVPSWAAGDRRPLLIGGVAGAVLLLLLCGGVGVYALTRPKSRATPTAQRLAAGTPTVASNATVSGGASPVAASGSPRASASAAASPPARAQSSPAGAAGGTPVPPGWKVYRGTAVPFSLAYPPDWTVDESSSASGVVYFRAPQDQATWLSIATTGKPETRTADELRDEFYKAQFANCQEKALDVTRDNEFSGVLFKSLGATCNLAGNLFYSYIGLGLNKAVPWRFQLNSPYNQYSKNTCRCEAGNIEKYFGAMLDSLTIYANP